ncbi:hypothetical protein EVAR_70992_1 [Eumeta japonica]|uniref:Ig-like domain-containing protein n=1 Tax=Eumeta variegata TaxID=151549 RepID=A0A4C2AIH1_EUMVA|nr:hypothetical protein EVAR_70992_1 [Eumeta japonica]
MTVRKYEECFQKREVELRFLLAPLGEGNTTLSKSNASRVFLYPVTLKSSGLYRCEVSAEAPSFASAAGEGRMEVIYLPREGPRITGNEQENRRGDWLFLNCTSGRSYPAAVLSWDIDGEKSSLLVEYPTIQHNHGLLSSALGLRVPAGRTMQVRCTARVAPAWLEGSEAVVGKSHLAESKEAMLLEYSMGKRAGDSSQSRWSPTSMDTRNPKGITGVFLASTYNKISTGGIGSQVHEYRGLRLTANRNEVNNDVTRMVRYV